MERSGRSAGLDSRIPQVSFVIASAVILALVVMLTTGGDSEPLTPILMVTGEWAPYSGQSLPDNGIAAAIVTTVMRRAGYEPSFRFMPWQRAEDAARANETNNGVRATFPYISTAERLEDFYYSDPIFDIELAVFYNVQRHPHGAGIRDIADLAEFDVVPMSGYGYPADVQRLIGDRAAADDNVAAFTQLVESDRPLVVIEATRVGSELLAGPLAAYVDVIAAAPLRFLNPIHLIASRNNPNNLALIRDFNAALAGMTDASLAEIEARVTSAIDEQRVVLLQPVDRAGWIPAFIDADGATSVLLPNGTRAVVERWSRRYIQPTDATAADSERVRIRVLNGPQRGKQLFVDPRTVVLP